MHAPVIEAPKALQLTAARNEQSRRRVKRRRRLRRRTATYVRQGEWFFIPQPDYEFPLDAVEHNGQLVRGAGKPHRAEWLYRSIDPGKRTYARGRVSHGDHATINLDVWHRVVPSAEATAIERSSTTALGRRVLPRVAMSYLD